MPRGNQGWNNITKKHKRQRVETEIAQQVQTEITHKLKNADKGYFVEHSNKNIGNVKKNGNEQDILQKTMELSIHGPNEYTMDDPPTLENTALSLHSSP